VCEARAVRFWEVKEEVRVLGVDDGPFQFGPGEKALVVGTVFRGGLWLEGLLTRHVDVDGDDATQCIINMVNSSRHRRQIRVVMTDGLTLAGFNVIDGNEVFRKTGLPVISVTRNNPDLKAIMSALKRFPDFDERWSRIEEAGPPLRHTFQTARGRRSVYFQAFGVGEEDARRIIDVTSTRSLIPEPIRVAHIIASGVVRGESFGRA